MSSSWRRVLLDSAYLKTKTLMWFEFIFLSAILFATCTCLQPPSKVRLASIPKHTQLYPHPNLHPYGSIPSSYNSLTPVPTFSPLTAWFLSKYQLKCHLLRGSSPSFPNETSLVPFPKSFSITLISILLFYLMCIIIKKFFFFPSGVFVFSFLFISVNFAKIWILFWLLLYPQSL